MRRNYSTELGKNSNFDDELNSYRMNLSKESCTCIYRNIDRTPRNQTHARTPLARRRHTDSARRSTHARTPLVARRRHTDSARSTHAHGLTQCTHAHGPQPTHTDPSQRTHAHGPKPLQPTHAKKAENSMRF
jgi:hypothetical protein